MHSKYLPLGGQWGIAIFMIIVVSWILYKYLAPQNLKEWRNAGLIQAFIIALYAEMYGFPLTIYLLTSFLGIDIPWLHTRGHLWGTLLGMGDNGAMIEMFVGFTFILVGLILMARGWYLIYNIQKKDELVTDGIYQHMRHPQYTGIFIALFGQLIHWPTILTLLMFPVIVWAYYHLARKEEKAMMSKFGDAYRTYMKSVP
ncbi:MAG: isoprenylcysteine carboxylmethyltransferase family protein, partial [Calditrichia bacterium]